MLGQTRRLALMAEGRFTPLDAKTAVGVLRYRPDEVVAVIDSTRAGRSAEGCVGVGGAIPVVADLAAAAALGADSLLIGVAPQGGELPPAWRVAVRAALASSPRSPTPATRASWTCAARPRPAASPPAVPRTWRPRSCSRWARTATSAR